MASAQLRECSEVLITRLGEIAAMRLGNQARKQGNNGGDFEKWNPSRALAMQLLGEMRTLRGMSVALNDLTYKPEFLVVKADEGLAQLRKQPAAFLLFQVGSPGVYALLEELEHRVNQQVSNDELATVVQVLQATFGDRARAAEFVTKYRTTSLTSSQSEILDRLHTELTRSP
jgi:hypothetical protein